MVGWFVVLRIASCTFDGVAESYFLSEFICLVDDAVGCHSLISFFMCLTIRLRISFCLLVGCSRWASWQFSSVGSCRSKRSSTNCFTAFGSSYGIS
jgi:hypothetical protein